MKVIQPNYTWIPRAQGIAQQMSAWPEVSYVESGPYSPTAVRFYKLSEVASFDRGVTVTLSYEGQCQKIRLFPKAEVSSREFLELVQAKLHTLKISPDVPISSQSVTNNPQAVVDPESSIKESPMAVAPIRRVFRGTDHNTIKGTDRFIDFLAEHPMVKKIVTARVQGGPQYTEPRAEFRSAKYAVQAYWINANAKQEILAFPADGTSVDRLRRLLEKSWQARNQRGGVSGESSHDPVLIPPRILELQQQGAQSQMGSKGIATADAEPPKNGQAMVTTLSQERAPIILSAQQAETYEFLLSLRPKGWGDRDFTLQAATAFLKKRFPLKSDASNRYRSMVVLGLIEPGKKITGSFNTKMGTIKFCKYTVSERRGASQRKSVLKPPTPPKAKKPVPSSTQATKGYDTSLGAHIAFFERRMMLLSELTAMDAERKFRERMLAQDHLAADVINGQVAIVRKKSS